MKQVPPPRTGYYTLMDILQLILLLAGIIIMGLGAARIGTPRFDFGWLGLTIIAVAVFLLPLLSSRI